jgi:signal transduction histidine kinase
VNETQSIGELGAALLQGTVTAGLALLLLHLHRRHGKEHFLWWAVALGVRALSVGAIVTFMVTGAFWLLFVHQVLIAWTALGFLFAAQVFSRQVTWQRWYAALLLLPAAWAYVAIFVLDHFAFAAGPAVVFLALATLWAGVVFMRYRAAARSSAAGFLALVLMLWAAHHLDYPILRARGAWDPWGYYVDILFVLAVGAGILLLVIEEQREGLRTLTALSGDLRRAPGADLRRGLLERPLALRGVRGAALLRARGAGTALVAATGEAEGWQADGVPDAVARAASEVLRSGRSRLEGAARPGPGAPPFIAVLPLGAASAEPLALAVVGDLAAPFAALDESILAVVGQQVGSALDRADLTERLEQRTADLERLSVRLLREHEEQRRRLGQELHDETAQVFSALKLQLGTLREEAPAPLQERFDRLVAWVDRGSQSIRSATDGLRPAVLDDLGLVPALRALISDVREWSGLAVTFDVSREEGTGAMRLPPESEVALFRALQEALSNVMRHADATTVSVALRLERVRVALRVTDDGSGIAPERIARLAQGAGRSGLFGMQQRIAAVDGTVRLSASGARGLTVEVEVPVSGSFA